MFRQSQTILFILLSIGFLYLDYLQTEETFFIYFVLQLIIGFLYFVTIVYTIFKIIKDTNPLRQTIKPLILGLCLIPTLYLAHRLLDQNAGKQTLIEASLDGGYNGILLDLNTDGTFKLLNSGPFGGTIYRGNYKLKNDTLTIDNEKLTYIYPKLKFVIKTSDDNKIKYFDPIDSSANHSLIIYKDEW